MKCIKLILTLFMLSVAGGAFYLYSGIYPIGADVPHHRATYWLLETLRERSVARAAEHIAIPDDLDSAERLLAGGADYNEMCSTCHLQPGRDSSDMSIGLYPAPPNLTEAEHGSMDETFALQRQFWIIKHGIKASAMPAWGPTHNDDRIWSMVAFLQRLPDLTADQYQIITSRTERSGAGHH